MATRNYDSKKAGSQESHEPRLLGSIVEEMLHGNSPLAKGYRQYIASQVKGEDEAEGWHTDTHLGVNLKTILRSDRRAKTGKSYLGVLRLDSDAIEDEFLCSDTHFTFVEALPQTEKRNPRIFNGRFITVTRRDDGSLRLNFKELKTGVELSVDGYAIGVCNEIRQALKGLIKEE